MDYIRRTFVVFFTPERFTLKSYVRPVKSRDPSKVKVPKRAFGFQFFDLVTKTVIVDGEEMELKSEQFNRSPRHYYGGRVYTLAELKLNFPNEEILISNVRGSSSRRAICCRTGEWHPFDEDDIFLKAA